MFSPWLGFARKVGNEQNSPPLEEGWLRDQEMRRSHRAAAQTGWSLRENMDLLATTPLSLF